MKCCFVGHRKVENAELVKEKVKEVVERLIVENGVKTFYFGSRSKFDDICHAVVTQFKGKYSEIKRIYVRAEYAYISDSYKKYLLESYEDTYMPDGVENAGNASYVKRNQAMIEVSDVCIFYYKDDYLPPRRKNAKKDVVDYQPKSGAKLAYDYAVRKKKMIINIAKEIKG